MHTSSHEKYKYQVKNLCTFHKVVGTSANIGYGLQDYLEVLNIDKNSLLSRIQCITCALKIS